MWCTLDGKARNQLRTYKGLAAIIKQTNYYKSVRDKDYLLDKVDWFVSSIIDTNLKLNQDLFSYVNIHSKRLKAFLGRDYNVIIDLLVELDLIRKNNNYSSNNFTKSYRLTSKLFKNKSITKVDLRTQRFGKKLSRINSIEFEKSLADPLSIKIIENTLNIFFLDETRHFIPQPMIEEIKEVNGKEVIQYKDNQFKIKRYYEFAECLNLINKGVSPEELLKFGLYFSPKKSVYGRLYHFICSVPSDIRQLIRTKKNELIYEVDMASAQLTILILEWIKSGDHRKAHKNEIEMILDLLARGEIYNYIQNESFNFDLMDYKKLKVEILKIINAKYNPGPGNRELLRIFPSFMNWINHIKKTKGNEKVSHIHQRSESDIFIDVYSKLPDEVFALPIHDCIISNEDNIRLIQERLINRFEEIYGLLLPFNIEYDQIFRIKRVSLREDELPFEVNPNENRQSFDEFVEFLNS